MTHKNFDALLEARVEKLKHTGQTKGRKYTGGKDDRVANFKEEATTLDLTPYQVWHVFFNKHVRAVESFCRTGANLGDELIENHLHDAIMYLFLLEGLVADVGEIEQGEPAVDLHEVPVCEGTGSSLTCGSPDEPHPVPHFGQRQDEPDITDKWGRTPQR